MSRLIWIYNVCHLVFDDIESFSNFADIILSSAFLASAFLALYGLIPVVGAVGNVGQGDLL